MAIPDGPAGRSPARSRRCRASSWRRPWTTANVVERTRAFVKVQDGCSFFCTYCIIPTARGPERSLAPETVLADVRRALAAGHREIVLTGINIGTYDGGWSERGPRGSHRAAALTLAGLVRRLLDETEVERIRLSSIEPQHVDDELLDVPGRLGWPRPAALPPPAPVGRRRRAPPDGPPLRRRRLRRDRRACPGRDPGRRDPRRRDRRLPDRGRRAPGSGRSRSSAASGSPASTCSATRRGRGRRRSAWPARSTRRTKKRRARSCSPWPPRHGRAFARREHVGRVATVLFETPPARRSLGRPRRGPRAGGRGRSDLENAIGRVMIEGIDREVADRAIGSIVALDRPRRQIRRDLPVLTEQLGGARAV